MVGKIWGQSPLIVALSHTSLAEPRSEGVALRFPAGTHRDCTHGHAQAQPPAQSLCTHTCTHGHSATTQGLEEHERCTQPFRAHWHTHTHAPAWGLSHTQSHTNTQAPGPHGRPQLRFLQEPGDREGGRRRPRHCSDPSPPTADLTRTRSSLSSEVGPGAGGGTRVLAPLSLSSPRRARLPFPTRPTSRPNFSLPHLPTSSPQRRSRWEPGVLPAPSPGRGSGGCTPENERGARPGSCPGASGEGGGKAPAGSRSAESRVRGLLLPLPGSVGEEPWDQLSPL